MTSSKWRIALPTLQVILAAILFVAAPYQYRTAVRAAGRGVGLEFFARHFPPPALQISYAMNYPALVAAHVLVGAPGLSRLNNLDLIRWNVDGGEFTLTARDLLFFIAVGCLWYVVSRAVEYTGDAGFRRLSAGVAMIVSAICFLFAAVVAYVAIDSLRSAGPALRQTAPAGLTWSIIMFAFSCWTLIRLRRGDAHSNTT